MIVSGYWTCTLFGLMKGQANVFEPNLLAWIKAFYALAVIQNIMTTGLMAYRIYLSHRHTAAYKATNSNLIKLMRILLESAALQLLAEVILLGLYSSNNSAQFILLEAMTPIVVRQ